LTRMINYNQVLKDVIPMINLYEKVLKRVK